MGPTWRLYYGDGGTFDDLDGPWASAPYRDVQYLLHRDPLPEGHPRHVGSVAWTGDFYLWYPGEGYPWAVDWAGLLDYLAEIGGRTDLRGSDLSLDYLHARGVKLGRTLAEQRWSEVRERAMGDPDFPKSARRSAGRAS